MKIFLGFLLFARDSFICIMGSRAKPFIKELYCLEIQIIYKFNKIINVQGSVGSVPMNDTVNKRKD